MRWVRKFNASFKTNQEKRKQYQKPVNNNKPATITIKLLLIKKPAEPRKPIIITKNVDKNSALLFSGDSLFFM
jgi:hypothetical protein